MDAYDALPPKLRAWLATAVLPWRPGSVLAAYEKALRRCVTPQAALAELDRLETRLIAKDARKIWGDDHPVVSDAGGA